MLTLLTFPDSFGQPSHSPYCVKAMCLLELAGVPWQPDYRDNPTKMPMGKLPVLRVGERLIPDSAHIQAYLEQTGADLHPGLTTGERAQAHAFLRLAEDSLSFHLVYSRWADDACWPEVREAFFKAIPGLLRKPITNKLRKRVLRGLNSHGITRFSEADRLERLRQDLSAISTQLGDKPFLFGTAPCAADAAVVPFLGMLGSLPADTKTRQMVRGWDGLEAYVTRGRAEMYPGERAPKLSAAA